jgi:hypothetical protein
MAITYSLQTSGQQNLIRSDNAVVDVPQDLAEAFPLVPGIVDYVGGPRTVTNAAPVDLDVGGITSMRAARITVLGEGSVTLKYGGNPVGVLITGSWMIEGTVPVSPPPQLTTASSTPVCIKYLFVE